MKTVYKPLSECVSFLSGGTPSKSNHSFWLGNVPWVSSGEMTQPRLTDTSLHITHEAGEKYSKIVPPDTILAVVRGMSLANEFRVALTRKDMAFNQDIKALIPKKYICSSFLFYSLYGRRFEIKKLASESAHGTKKLDTKVLESIPVWLPPLPIQRKIAAILSAYDDLIENCDRRITLLEKMAEEIYREWFVRLRFPGHEQTIFHKGIPEGWETTQIKNVCTVARGSSPRPINDSRYFVNGTIPWIKIADATASRMFLYETKEHVNDFGASFSRKLPKGSLIIATSGTLGFSIFLGIEGCVHDGWMYLTGYRNNVKPSFLYYVINHYTEHLNSLSYGAAIQNINTEIIRRLPLVLPPEDVLEDFYLVIEPIHEEIDTLGRVIKNLKQTRDRLLTRLISGKLSVKDLDIQFPPSMVEDV